MFQIIEPTEIERNHPDFIQGWNACLDDAPVSGASIEFHRGWMSARQACAEDNASVLNILHRVWSPEPDVIISFRPVREPVVV